LNNLSFKNLVDEPEYRNRTFIFKDRIHAGKLLADKLKKYAKENVQLLAIPAGGVPVGYTVAKNLNIPMDIAIVRKVQIPWNTEAGFGAVTWDGTVILNDILTEQLGLTEEVVKECILRTKEIIRERTRKFRGDKPFPHLKGKVIILIDDGLASGFTMLATVKSLKTQLPQKVNIVVPTASISAVELLASNVDELTCLNIRSGPTFAVADAYRNWYDLTDEEVMKFLKLM